MTTLTNDITLVGNGLWLANTREAAQLRANPGYLPAIDPRLPSHTKLAAGLNSIYANAEIVVSNISIFADTSTITATGPAVFDSQRETLVLPVSSTVGIPLGSGIVSASMALTRDLVVLKVYSANSRILIGPTVSNISVTAGEILHFPDVLSLQSRNVTVANTAAGTDFLLNISNTTDVKIGSLLTTANIAETQAVRVTGVFTNNSSIIVSPVTANVVVARGETLRLSYYKRQGVVRIKEETILYDHSWAANSTLTGLTRGFANSTVTTANAGFVITSLGSREV